MKRAIILFLCLLTLPIVATAATSTYSGIGELVNYILKSVTTGYEHHEIHGGNSYCASHNETLSTGEKIQFLVNTPSGDTLGHMIILVRSSGESNYEVYEDTTVSALGAAVDENNHNRDSSNTASIAITNGPTISTLGTKLTGLTQHIGAGQQRGGVSDRGGEIVLDSGSLYLINVTSEANTNDTTLTLDWYESSDAF